jgi:hypothetical protein
MNAGVVERCCRWTATLIHEHEHAISKSEIEA